MYPGLEAVVVGEQDETVGCLAAANARGVAALRAIARRQRRATIDGHRDRPGARPARDLTDAAIEVVRTRALQI